MAIHWGDEPQLELRQSSTRGDLPVRIYDSRQPDPFNTTGAISGGESRNIFVDIWPPHTRVGVAGAFTITLANTVGAGYLVIYPADLTVAPGISTINWSASGLMLASGLITRLGAEPSQQEPAWESRLTVDCVGGSTDFVIDLTAFWHLSTV